MDHNEIEAMRRLLGFRHKSDVVRVAIRQLEMHHRQKTREARQDRLSEYIGRVVVLRDFGTTLFLVTGSCEEGAEGYYLVPHTWKEGEEGVALDVGLALESIDLHRISWDRISHRYYRSPKPSAVDRAVDEASALAFVRGNHPAWGASA